MYYSLLSKIPNFIHSSLNFMFVKLTPGLFFSDGYWRRVPIVCILEMLKRFFHSQTQNSQGPCGTASSEFPTGEC